jgi:hypothetical protein
MISQEASDIRDEPVEHEGPLCLHRLHCAVQHACGCHIHVTLSVTVLHICHTQCSSACPRVLSFVTLSITVLHICHTQCSLVCLWVLHLCHTLHVGVKYMSHSVSHSAQSSMPMGVTYMSHSVSHSVSRCYIYVTLSVTVLHICHTQCHTQRSPAGVWVLHKHPT